MYWNVFFKVFIGRFFQFLIPAICVTVGLAIVVSIVIALAGSDWITGGVQAVIACAVLYLLGLAIATYESLRGAW